LETIGPRRVAGFCPKLAGGAWSVRRFTAPRAGGLAVKNRTPETERPRQAVVEPLCRGGAESGRRLLPVVNAVFANEIR
jgi:hypothetical protein